MILKRGNVFGTFVVIGVSAASTFGGSLTPPAGPVAPTPGPEPRIAISAANTPGDSNSVYKIAAPGSYYLTGNVAGVAAKHGIEITVSGVTVDLMGFEVRGVAGSLDGVTVSTNLLRNIAVLNGHVRGWGEDGVDFGGASTVMCSVESIQATENGKDGIFVGNAALVLRCIAHENGEDGIDTGSACVVEHCTAKDNVQHGYAIGGTTTLTSCAAFGNSGDGISIASACTVSACVSYDNAGDGIIATGSTNITGCHSRFNGGDGIEVSTGSYLLNNSCVDNNTGAGIHCTSVDNRVEGNSCISNLTGVLIDSSDNIVVRNSCASNVTNWTVVAGNAILVIGAAGAPAVNGNSGGLSPGSTNPFANYTY